ncbi:MAG: hypothetical protein ABIU05_20230 [Nitrospirales bacterium]
MTILVTTLLGIGGALVDGFLGRMLELYGEGTPVGLALAVMAVILVAFLYRKPSGHHS